MILCGFNCNIKPFNLYMGDDLAIMFNLCSERIEVMGINYLDKDTAISCANIWNTETDMGDKAPCS